MGLTAEYRQMMSWLIESGRAELLDDGESLSVINKPNEICDAAKKEGFSDNIIRIFQTSLEAHRMGAEQSLTQLL